jgi:hypothetical protein
VFINKCGLFGGREAPTEKEPGQPVARREAPGHKKENVELWILEISNGWNFGFFDNLT